MWRQVAYQLVRWHIHQQARMSGGTSCGRNITFGNITDANVNQLRKMNASIFPVRYHDKFYADAPNGNPDFNQFGERVHAEKQQKRVLFW